MTTDRPACPRCGLADRVYLPGEPFGPSAGGGDPAAQAWCGRCTGFVAALHPLPRRDEGKAKEVTA